MSFAEFERDDRTSYAVIRAFEIIGEAAKRIPDELRAQGARGREFVEQNYDWEVVFEPLDALLDIDRDYATVTASDCRDLVDEALQREPLVVRVGSWLED